MCVRNIYKQVIIYTLGVIMNRKLLGILFILIVSVSACPGSSVDFNPNAGIVIEDMSFDIPKVYDDDVTALMFDVVNVGGKPLETSETVNVYVYGPTIEAASGSVEVWRFENPPEGVSASNGYISTSVTSTSLPAPDPSLGTPGGRKSFEFEFDPADVLDGMEIPTKFHVSLCYPYNTKTLTQVEVTSRNELRATGVHSSRKDTVNAGGPIHLSVQGDGNIRSGSVMPLVFKVTDVGGGFSTLTGTTCVADLPTSDRNRVEVEVTIDGDTKVDCGASGTNKNTVRIKKGVGTLFCTYNLGSSTAPRRTYMVHATATYKYYDTSTVTITNIGSSMDAGSSSSGSSDDEDSDES